MNKHSQVWSKLCKCSSVHMTYRECGRLGAHNNCEPRRETTGSLPMRKQRRRSAVTAQPISAFVFATGIEQFVFFLNPKFQASILFLKLYRPVCATRYFPTERRELPCLSPTTRQSASKKQKCKS